MGGRIERSVGRIEALGHPRHGPGDNIGTGIATAAPVYRRMGFADVTQYHLFLAAG